MKKVLSVLIVTMLIVSLVPMSVFASAGAMSALTFNSADIFASIQETTATDWNVELTQDQIDAATVVVAVDADDLDGGKAVLISSTGGTPNIYLNPTVTAGTTLLSAVTGTAFNTEVLKYGDVLWVIDGVPTATDVAQYVRIVVSMPSGGTINGGSSVKSPVINVVLPMNLNFSLDPSQMVNGAGDGNQIASSNYVVKNLSDAKVLVGFTLTATANNSASLVAAKTDITATRYDTSKNTAADKKAFFAAVPARTTTDDSNPATTETALTLSGLNISSATYAYDSAKAVKFDTADSDKAKLSFLLDAPTGGTTLTDAGVGAFELYAEMNAYAPWASGDITIAGAWSIASLAAKDTSTTRDAATLNMVGAAIVPNTTLTAGAAVASLTVTKAQVNAGYNILLKTANGSASPSGTITSIHWADTGSNDVKSVFNYTSATGILQLKTNAWDSFAAYGAKLVITMSSGEIYTITKFNYALA